MRSVVRKLCPAPGTHTRRAFASPSRHRHEHEGGGREGRHCSFIHNIVCTFVYYITCRTSIYYIRCGICRWNHCKKCSMEIKNKCFFTFLGLPKFHNKNIMGLIFFFPQQFLGSQVLMIHHAVQHNTVQTKSLMRLIENQMLSALPTALVFTIKGTYIASSI